MTRSNEISLDEFVKNSIWPGRITGEYEWEIPERDINKVKKEYDDIKYERLLEFVQANNIQTCSEIRREQIDDMANNINNDNAEYDLICYSQRKKIYISSLDDKFERGDCIFVKSMSNILSGNEIIIELGSGYGHNLSLLNSEFQNCTYIGGDVSSNAVEISREVNRGESNISVEIFNYYDDHWAIFDQEFDEDVVVFTRHSIEQLPKANQIIQSFVEQAPTNIREILHYEPVYTMSDTGSLLGLLRRGYTRINDYNRDLLRVIKNNPEFDIIESKYDIFGNNVLNPTSLIRWKLCS